MAIAVLGFVPAESPPGAGLSADADRTARIVIGPTQLHEPKVAGLLLERLRRADTAGSGSLVCTVGLLGMARCDDPWNPGPTGRSRHSGKRHRGQLRPGVTAGRLPNPLTRLLKGVRARNSVVITLHVRQPCQWLHVSSTPMPPIS